MLPTLTFALVLTAPVPKTVPVGEPKGPPPTLIYLKGDGTLLTATQQVLVTEAVPVVQERVIAQPNGAVQRVKVTVMETRTVTRPVKATYAAKGATFRTAGGRKLAAEDAEARLKAGEVCALVPHGQTADKSYLSVLKDDTLVIELGEQPRPIPVPPPAAVPLPAPAPPAPAPQE